MKNIIFYSISLSLVGLLCCHDQANDSFALNILGLADIENISTIFDDIASELSPPSSYYFKMLCVNLWNQTIVILYNMYNSFLTGDAIKISDKNTVKRVTRNANTADGPLTRTNITEQSQIISSSTESILFNNSIENQTQPHIEFSTVTNLTLSTDLLSETFLAVKPLTNDITKQNVNGYDSDVSKILNRLSTWIGYLNIKKHMYIVSIIVSSALLLLFLRIMMFVTYSPHQLRNSRRDEINQQLEV